jgi:two-component system, NarL family, sensor histidine kinase DesK
MKLRLLPDNPDIGWLPYGWLVYLLFLLPKPLLTGASAGEWAATIGSIFVFVVLYLYSYWLPGRKKLFTMAGLVVLGTLMARTNSASSVFFIYAAGFAGQLGSAAFGVQIIAALLVMLGLVSYLVNPDPSFWITGMVFMPLVGAVDVHFAQRRKANRRLQLAQDEIERLAKIAERERIARDLHDLLGHTLSLIVLKSELASKLADKDIGKAVTEIRDVERISREALTEVRAAVRGYRAGSITAEAQQAAKALETAGVAVETEIEAVPLTPIQESVLALAIREAVTNVVRHAKATVCKVRLKASGEACELEVSDNGGGGNGPDGSGLSGMRERIEALGGSLERDGRSGTRLRIRLPLSPT